MKLLIIILAIFTAVGIFSLVGLAQGTPEQRISEGKDSQTAKNSETGRGDKNSSTNVTVILSQDGTTDGDSSKNQDNQSEQDQRRLVKFTDQLVKVSFFQALILFGTGWLIYHQISIMKNTERAWILTQFVKATPPLTTDLTDIKGFSLQFRVQNYGKTPARIIRNDMIFKSLQKGASLPSKPIDDEPEIFDLMLPPGGHAPFSVDIPAHFFAAAIAGNETLYVYGFVDYKSFRFRARRTRFCYRFNISEPVFGTAPQPKMILDLTAPVAYTKCT